MSKLVLIVTMLCLSLQMFSQDSELLRKAEAGDTEAQFQMALAFTDGFFPSNHKEVNVGNWLKKAASNGHVEAMYWLSKSYYYGHYGIQQDNDEYIYWLKKTAKNGHPIALYDMGMDCIYNFLDYPETKKYAFDAFELFERSANRGSLRAAVMMYIMNDEGTTGQKDKQQAIYWAKKCLKMDGIKPWESRRDVRELHEKAKKYLAKIEAENLANDNVVASNSSKTSSSSSSSSSSALRYKDTYSIGALGHDVSTGMIRPIIYDLCFTIEFYDDYITVHSIRYDYKGETANGRKIYTAYLTDTNYESYSVDNNYGVIKIFGVKNPDGRITETAYTVTKGVFSAPIVQPDSYSGGYSSGESQSAGTRSNGSSYSTKKYQRDCHLCGGSGKCRTCNGSHRYLNPLTNKYLSCPNCTPNGACSACGGTGKRN